MSRINFIVLVSFIGQLSFNNLHTALLRESPVHSTREKSDNGALTLKTQEMFSIYTATEKFKNMQWPAIFDLYRF